METKTCSKCGETKEATTEFFSLAKRGLFGVRQCVACM